MKNNEHMNKHYIMPEQQNIEYKSIWKDEYLRWICGFANAFFRGGYVEAWGRGIDKINEHCTDAGLPLPLIYYNTSGCWVEFRKDVYNNDSLKELGLNERQRDALLFFKEKGEITTSAYMKQYNIAERTARYDLIKLVENKILTRSGDTNSSKFIFL